MHARMNDDDDFIREADETIPRPGELTGWEVVRFELADAEDPAE